MNNSPLPIVSVVVPMFNVGKYIEQCINSVLTQSFKNFELICVDDGCTDDTLSKLKQFSDKRIRVIRQQNRGLSGARNTGITYAKGIYVALLDADDFWVRDKLALHVSHLNRNPEVGVSYCPSLFVNEQGEQMGFGQYPKLKDISAKDILCRNPVGNGSAPVIRRRLFSEVSLDSPEFDRVCAFDEELRQSEDIELWIRIALKKKWKFEGIETPLTYYRVNDTGLSANLTKQYSSWQLAMSKNQPGNVFFFRQYLSLARAYQLRYLSRRAIRSGDTWKALKLVNKALFTQPKILFEEPKRTLLTYGCALASVLPKRLFKLLENKAVAFLSRHQQTAS